MGMLRVCSTDGCETKTLGPYCIDHEPANVASDLSDVLHAGAAVHAQAENEPQELQKTDKTAPVKASQGGPIPGIFRAWRKKRQLLAETPRHRAQPSVSLLPSARILKQRAARVVRRRLCVLTPGGGVKRFT
jgi:hypothetical protein